MLFLGFVIAAHGLGGCVSQSRSSAVDVAAVDRVLDAWHDAAHRGDGPAYFGAMTDDAVFIGTDATERWVGREFVDFAEPYFDGENAWTYVPRSRQIESLGTEPPSAWFDELLDSPSYGTSRGFGVVLLGDDGVWRITQYALTFPIPNELAKDMTAEIKAFEASAASETDGSR